MFDSGAFQAATATATKVPLPDGTRWVRILNLGPQVLYAAATAAKCTTALAMQIPATTGVLEIDIAGHDLFLRAAVADQTTPADTRWIVLG